MCEAASTVSATCFGRRPYAATATPAMIKYMPKIMLGSIGMPARTKPLLWPIQNIGTCNRTPMTTAMQPRPKAQTPRLPRKTLASIIYGSWCANWFLCLISRGVSKNPDKVKIRYLEPLPSFVFPQKSEQWSRHDSSDESHDHEHREDAL